MHLPKKKIHNTFSPLQLIIIVPVVENDISGSQPGQIQVAKIRNLETMFEKKKIEHQ